VKRIEIHNFGKFLGTRRKPPPITLAEVDTNMAKITKSAADYVSHAKKQHCHDCQMFRIFNARCSLVEGHINDDATCQYWKGKVTG
jgi:hypothetical protein